MIRGKTANIVNISQRNTKIWTRFQDYYFQEFFNLPLIFLLLHNFITFFREAHSVEADIAEKEKKNDKEETAMIYTSSN